MAKKEGYWFRCTYCSGVGCKGCKGTGQLWMPPFPEPPTPEEEERELDRPMDEGDK